MPPRAAGRRLILVRHGRTAWNAVGRYQGHADIGLDAEGERQVAALIPALACLHPARVVTSDLRRARQTAGPIAVAVGLVARADVRLREVDLGSWEGLTNAEAKHRFPDEFTAWHSGDDLPRGGGESRAAAGRRAVAALVEHCTAVPPGAVVVAVSHGLVLAAAVRILAALGQIDLGEEPPHLGNAMWLDLDLALR